MRFYGGLLLTLIYSPNLCRCYDNTKRQTYQNLQAAYAAVHEIREE